MAYQFATEQDIRRIVRSVLTTERNLLNKPIRRGARFATAPIETYVGYTDQGTVPARSGTTAGSQTITLCEFNDSNVISTTTTTLTVLNVAGAAVASNTYVMIKREPFSGKWVVDFEDCGA